MVIVLHLAVLGCTSGNATGQPVSPLAQCVLLYIASFKNPFKKPLLLLNDIIFICLKVLRSQCFKSFVNTQSSDLVCLSVFVCLFPRQHHLMTPGLIAQNQDVSWPLNVSPATDQLSALEDHWASGISTVKWEADDPLSRVSILTCVPLTQQAFPFTCTAVSLNSCFAEGLD